MKPSTSGIHLIGSLLFGFALFSFPAIASQQTPDKPTLIIDDITCRGNETTDCSFITNKYYQQIGEAVEADEIADARLRLGTLFQFKSVDIYLEKGHKRGHVVVVFDVDEASHLHYELGLGYEYAKIVAFLRRDRLGLSSKVTNFNFLGTGKELSFEFSGARIDSNSDRISAISSHDLDGNLTIFEFHDKNSSETDNYSAKLSYYDPHFYGSSHYYVAANLRINKWYVDNLDTVLRNVFEDPTPEIVRYKSDRSYYSHNLVVGRRFGSYSFVSLDVVHTNAVEIDQTTFGLTYGWNSEDDLLFPTKGSAFSTRLSKYRDEHEIELNYKKNFSLNANNIISLGTNLTYNLPNSYCTYCPLVLIDSVSATLFGRYSNIEVIDKQRGSYSGWHIGVYGGKGNINEEIYQYSYYGIDAGYTLQTDNMIYRFSLAFNRQDTK